MFARDLRGQRGAPSPSGHIHRLARGATGGFTLVEILVVLIVLGLSATLVAPALLPPRQDASASLGRVIAHVQDMAARRQETLTLDVSSTGHWEVSGFESPREGILEDGYLSEGLPAAAFALRVAPSGPCGLTLEADSLGWRPPVDPLTCRLVSP